MVFWHLATYTRIIRAHWKLLHSRNRKILVGLSALLMQPREAYWSGNRVLILCYSAWPLAGADARQPIYSLDPDVDERWSLQGHEPAALDRRLFAPREENGRTGLASWPSDDCLPSSRDFWVLAQRGAQFTHNIFSYKILPALLHFWSTILPSYISINSVNFSVEDFNCRSAHFIDLCWSQVAGFSARPLAWQWSPCSWSSGQWSSWLPSTQPSTVTANNKL